MTKDSTTFEEVYTHTSVKASFVLFQNEYLVKEISELLRKVQYILVPLCDFSTHDSLNQMDDSDVCLFFAKSSDEAVQQSSRTRVVADRKPIELSKDHTAFYNVLGLPAKLKDCTFNPPLTFEYRPFKESDILHEGISKLHQFTRDKLNDMARPMTLSGNYVMLMMLASGYFGGVYNIIELARDGRNNDPDNISLNIFASTMGIMSLLIIGFGIYFGHAKWRNSAKVAPALFHNSLRGNFILFCRYLLF